MERFLNRFAPACFALLRIVAGLLFACHGAQKLFGVLGGTAVPLTSQMGAAGVIELAGGLLIAVGFLTSYAAFIASGEMAVAYFQAHAPHGFWPILNHGELPVLFSFLFLYIAARGTVAFGVDARVARGQAADRRAVVTSSGARG
jgi:putative oxidoreductase